MPARRWQWKAMRWCLRAQPWRQQEPQWIPQGLPCRCSASRWRQLAMQWCRQVLRWCQKARRCCQKVRQWAQLGLLLSQTAQMCHLKACQRGQQALKSGLQEWRWRQMVPQGGRQGLCRCSVLRWRRLVLLCCRQVLMSCRMAQQAPPSSLQERRCCLQGPLSLRRAPK